MAGKNKNQKSVFNQFFEHYKTCKLAVVTGFLAIFFCSTTTQALPAPIIDSISQSTSSTGGGQEVIISGDNFYPETTVMFGAQPSDAINYIDTHTIVAITPPYSPKTVNITISNPGVEATTILNSAMTFTDPIIDSVTPNSGISAGGESVSIDGSNFDPSFYSREITINNSSGKPLENYQTSFIIDTASLIASSKMESDCGDLRVRGEDKSYYLPYWIEDGTCNTSTTKVWVKLDIVGKFQTRTIYATYGRSGLQSKSNGHTVFDFFDDFSGSTLDTSNWPTTIGSPTVSGGKLTLANDQGVFAGNYLLPSGTIWETSADPKTTSRLGSAIRAATSTGSGFIGTGLGDLVDILWFNDGNIYSESNNSQVMGAYATGFKRYKITYRPNDTDNAIYDYNFGSTVTFESNVNAGNTLHPILYISRGTGSSAQWDWIFVRKYMPTEPSVQVGSEVFNTSQITFGGVDAKDIGFMNSGNFSVTTPAHPGLGYVDIGMLTPHGAISTLTNGFFYNNIFDQAHTTFSADPTTLDADGNSYTDLVATIKDSYDNPLPGKTIHLNKTAGSASPNFYAIDCTNFITIDNTNHIDTLTDADGKACFRAKSTTAGSATFTATNVSDSNTDLSATPTVTFSELPNDASRSSFVASPTTVASNNTAYTTLIVTLKNTQDLPQRNQTVTITNDGTGITLSPVACLDSPAVPGTSGSDGRICYHAKSGTRQVVNFTATTDTGNVVITENPQVTFGLPLADQNASTFQEYATTIEPIKDGSYDYNNFSNWNGAFIKVIVRSDTNTPLPNRAATLILDPVEGYHVRNVDCDNPRHDLDLPSSITDSFGRVCFVVYKIGDLTPNLFESTNISLSVDEGDNNPTILTTNYGISSASLSNLGIFDFRFRNDDGDEMTATPVDNANTAYYNLDPANPFRLRFNISHKTTTFLGVLDEDELSPLQTVNVGPRPLNDYGFGLQDLRSFSGLAFDPTSNHLYQPAADLTNSKMRIYDYSTDDISAAPTHFDIPASVKESAAVDDPNQAITGTSEYVSKTFLDSTNQLMYVVFSPLSMYSQTLPVKVYKINVSTHEVIDVLSEDPNNSADFTGQSLDSQIDLTHGFLYLTMSNSVSPLNSAPEPRIIKIKLNDPGQAMSKVGTLVLAHSNDLLTSSVIDTTNQYLYVTYGNPTQIAKIDLNVAPSSTPVKVNQIQLVANPDQSPQELVGIQAAVIDTINGYAYFASSDFLGTGDNVNYNKAKGFITKVDIDPNRNFSVIARLQTSASDYYTKDTISGAEIFYVSPDNLPLTSTAAQIDVTNQYAYFVGIHNNLTIGFPAYMIYRVNLADFSHDNNYDELTYPFPETQTIRDNIFLPTLGKGYLVRYGADGDVLTEYNGTTRNNFAIQSAPNVNSEHCNAASEKSYVWTTLPNSAFTLNNSPNINDGEKSTNVSGLLSDNNESYTPGRLKDISASTDTILLGRNNYTELEYSLKATNDAKGSYCFRLIDQDPNHKNQTGANPNLIYGRMPDDFDFDISEHYAPLTINGIIFSKTSLNIIEGTTTDSYGVKLASRPSANVIVHFNANDGRLVLSPDATPASPTETELTFTSSNWDEFQYITLSAPKNTVTDGTNTDLIHQTVESTDPAYNNILVRPMTYSITDYGATTANVIANVTGEASMNAPENFSFPNVEGAATKPVFSPNLNLSVQDNRGPNADYTVTMQTSPFCKEPGKCIPLDKIYLTTSDLINPFNDLSGAQIGQFIANYLQENQSISARETYIHSNSADDRTLDSPITLIDTRSIPDNNDQNPLQGLLTFAIHLMIDYPNIPTLELGQYSTILTFDFNPTP